MLLHIFEGFLQARMRTHISQLAGAKIDAHSFESLGAGLLRRAAKDICTPGDFEPNETRSLDKSLQLCFQQSAGNSAGPEIYLPLGAFRYRFLHQNVADLQPAFRLENTRHFAQRHSFARRQVEYAVRNNHIRPAILNRQVFGVAQMEICIGYTGFRSCSPRFVEHRLSPHRSRCRQPAHRA